MDRAAYLIARLLRAGRRAYGKKASFLVIFACIFLLSLAILARLDLLPDPSAPKADAAPAATLASTSTPETLAVSAPAEPEEPVKIEIPSISLTATIANPTTTNIDALDALLLKGAVRYPTSAELNENGNVVIFGHSSYLPIVNNLAYKTFDGIQKLTPGATITVYSSDTVYTYQVRSVAKENINEAVIPLSVSGKVLTLSTCNSFATKDDRFVVTADFVESHPLQT